MKPITFDMEIDPGSERIVDIGGIKPMADHFTLAVLRNLLSSYKEPGIFAAIISLTMI